jgi:hypothetical protein
MSKSGDLCRRLLAPVLIRLWPSLANPAWRLDSAAAFVGGPLRIEVAPSRVVRKLTPEAQRRIKGEFLVRNLGDQPMDMIDSLYTYHDMVEIARHREDFRATCLYRWFRASIDAARPVAARGVVIDSDAAIERYYRVYLDMLLSLEAKGYTYAGDDDMCFGVTAKREVVLVRRGTHRLAAAQILGLPMVSGIVTHIDRAFVEECRLRYVGAPLAAAIAQGVQELAARP